jgi:AraC-like DNA-binding protein
VGKPSVLWIDLREHGSDQLTFAELLDCCRFFLLHDITRIAQQVASRRPEIICFEFDYPDPAELQVLQQTKNCFPSIPILMLTEQRSEELVIWALRARVWDYLVKPIESEDLRRRVSAPVALRSGPHDRMRRRLVQPHQKPLQHSLATTTKKPDNNVSRRAIAYLGQHFHEKVSLLRIAEQCGMSPYQFSRTFKREQARTFKEFLIYFRIEKACELLADSEVSIGDVAFAVGFGDHSHFTRTFKRTLGVSPSDYRRSARAEG